MARTNQRKTTEYLQKTIEAIITNSGAERNLYAYIRDLLINPSLGVGWKRDNIVIDTSVGSGIPDIIIYPNGLNGKPNKASYNAAIIFEGKTRDQVLQRAEEIFEEKKKYIQISTRWMILFDQTIVRFIGIGNGNWDETYDYEWQALKNYEYFVEAFNRISSKSFDIDNEVKLFRKGETKFSWLDVNSLGTDKFLQVIKEVSKALRDQISRLVTSRAVEDIKSVVAELDNLSPSYGSYKFFPAGQEIKIKFPEVTKLSSRFTDPTDIINYIDGYDRAQERLSILTLPYQWALKIEHLLVTYSRG